ncbi:hypothetical protein ZIOFF_012359 [Zingiber officinale]|uniref:DUF4005 domain-containing protein n=1 Tax=Zingiber officinale TaxID=94328 RepID=A0A8J5I7U4_ZINOF|nr:hypothetical protein ZIOFF_012359 [Zingiber officinale]
MGEKGRWFSAIKRAFTASSKEEAPDPPRGRTVTKKRWGFGMSKHGQISTFIHGEPSSIEKILEDAESECRRRRVQTTIELDHARVSAIKIQAAYRGYRVTINLNVHCSGNEIERRLMELYGGSREAGEAEVQGAEGDDEASEDGEGAGGEAADGQHHAPHAEARPGAIAGAGVEVAHGGDQTPSASPPRGKKPSSPSDFLGGHGGWDDSLLAKEQLEARMRRKVEAVAKRERALAYAYSPHVRHITLLEATHESAEAMLTGAAPRWWTWLERQAPPSEPPAAGHSRPKQAEADADAASLTSCPPFAAPNYMTPTASAKAKARAAPNPQQEPRKKRFSFGLSQSISSLFAGKETAASAAGTERSGGRQRRHRPTRSVGSVSMDSAMSVPVGAVARRSFVK